MISESPTRKEWNAQLHLARAALSSELLHWAEYLTTVARDTMLAELSCDTVEAWLKADGWHRRSWHKGIGTEWAKSNPIVGAFFNSITVPDCDDDMDAKRHLVVDLARFHPAGNDTVDAVMNALLRQQEEFRRAAAVERALEASWEGGTEDPGAKWREAKANPLEDILRGASLPGWPSTHTAAGHPDCPHDEPLHDHHDGCPACDYPGEEEK